MKKYLVIQQKMVGDVLLSTVVCEHLKTNIEGCEVHYLINSHTYAVVKGNPHIDKVIFFKPEFRRNKPRFFSFLKNLGKEHYHAVIDLYCNLESNIISAAANSSLKISYKKWYSSFIYHNTIAKGEHARTELGGAIEARILLLKPLMAQLKEPSTLPKIHLTDEEIKKAQRFLTSHKIDAKTPFLVIGALGSNPLKTYPLPYMAKLLDSIAETHPIPMLLNALPTQWKEVDRLIKKCAPTTQRLIKNDVYVDDLRNFLAVLSLSRGFFGNEGGAGNMARALGIPNFSIFSPWISKEAWLTDSANPLNAAVHLADFHTNLKDIPKKSRKKNALAYYEQFLPELILPRLKAFLHQEIMAQ